MVISHRTDRAILNDSFNLQKAREQVIFLFRIYLPQSYFYNLINTILMRQTRLQLIQVQFSPN